MQLSDRKWESYPLDSMFDIYTGTDLIIRKVESGNIPIISHAATNNGVATWSGIIMGRKLFDCKKTISLADRGIFKAFVQKSDFYIGTRVKALEAKKAIPIKALIFIVNLINAQAVKFSYGHNACDNVGRIKVMLPIDGHGNPDYDFMEDFTKEQEERKRQKYIAYAQSAINGLSYKEIQSIDEKNGKTFLSVGKMEFSQ